MKRARIVALARKEWREIARDRIFLMLAFVLPAVLMLVFGHGMNQEVERVGLAVLDEDHSATSRAYVDHFTHTEHFRFLGYLESPRQIDSLLASGRGRLVLWIAPGFERDLYQRRAVPLQFAIDGTFTMPARTLRGYVEAINGAASIEFQAGYLARATGMSAQRVAPLLQPLRLEVRYLYNEEVRSIWTVAPSLLMLILLLVPPLLMAVSVVREKETGSIYNVRCSTLTRGEFIVGKLVPNLLVSAVNAVILWALAVFYFGAPFKGSLPVFAAGTALYVLGTSAVGLLVSMLVRTQQAAIIITTMAAIIVAIQFSGLFAPVSSMRGTNYVLAHLFPATYYYDIVIGTFLKKTGLDVLRVEFLFLALFAAALLGLCYRLFRKRTAT